MYGCARLPHAGRDRTGAAAAGCAEKTLQDPVPGCAGRGAHAPLQRDPPPSPHQHRRGTVHPGCFPEGTSDPGAAAVAGQLHHQHGIALDCTEQGTHLRPFSEKWRCKKRHAAYHHVLRVQVWSAAGGGSGTRCTLPAEPLLCAGAQTQDRPGSGSGGLRHEPPGGKAAAGPV